MKTPTFYKLIKECVLEVLEENLTGGSNFFNVGDKVKNIYGQSGVITKMYMDKQHLSVKWEDGSTSEVHYTWIKPLETSNEGFDPTSQGPNPYPQDNPYPSWNAEMRALEEEEKLDSTRPKKLKDLIHDEWNEGEEGHWVQLKPGWTVDDCVVIHEPTKNKAYARLRDAKFTGLTENKTPHKVEIKPTDYWGEIFYSVFIDGQEMTAYHKDLPVAHKYQAEEIAGEILAALENEPEDEYAEEYTDDSENDGQNSQPTGETSVDHPINPLSENEHGRYAQEAGAGQFDPRTFGQLKDEYDPDGTKHDLTLKCIKCGKTETCRCSKPKRTFEGICNECSVK